MRTALYARTACLTQNLKSAVELQLEALRNYATQNGMEIVEEFTDAGYSGLGRNRPGLNRMYEMAGRRGFDVLLTQDPGRLARNSVLQVSLLEELEQCGVTTIFLEGQVLSTNDFDVKAPADSDREEAFAVEGCSDELRKSVTVLARGTSRPHFATPEKSCSNRRIFYRGGE
ncbi:MAG TPA: recombinase family protein [Chthoniobacterales bacterium]|jgi:hypothetical protein|nr:recombinase family protein [Chthoniobacterales bacterium]